MSDEKKCENSSKPAVVLKGQDRILPGFEESKSSMTWASPFFFVQAADTQLGMIVNWGDGTIWYVILALS